MNINRDYLIINDVKKSNITLDNGSMFFYITDKNTQNIFVNLVINVSNNDLIQKYANIENAEDYTLTMNIVKPDNTYKVIEGKLHDKEKAIFEFDLNEDCCDEIGTYRCELLTKCYINDREEITTSNKITYKVKSSVLNDLDDIVEVPEYPLVIQLFDKLSDIEQYEEDRRANELARQLAEEQRQTRFDKLNTDIDNKMVDVENRITTKEQAVDKLIVDTKADIDDYKVAKDQEINEYKALKDTEINNAITTQDNKINEFINERNDRLDATETKNTEQDNRLDVAENRLANIGDDITNTMQPIIDGHTARLEAIEAIDVSQNNRLDAIEAKNQQQDDRLLDIEKVNNRQDIDIKCLYGASQTIDVTKEGNSIYLQNSNNGFTIVDEIKGNTLVNCNKEPDKELILNGNVNTSGDNTVTITEGVDGGLVDVALEGNTLVNVSKTKDSTALPLEEDLTYLYANTQYTIQFISYAAITVGITLGGTKLLAQYIVAGLNRISITTPATLTDNKLIISGVGANIMEVIVTDIDRELIYFEGMKSVGEGKELQVISINSDRRLVNTQRLTHEPLRGTRDAKDKYVLIDGKWYIERKCGIRAYQEGDENNYKTDLVNTVYPLEMPTYEEIDYNPLEVYSGTTNITTNSTIPCNITVKNHGFNCLLKPSTTYTISSNLGLNTVTTPSTLTEDCLRFMDTDTSDVTTMKDVLILEGDWTTKADLMPANFSGIESTFEQELVIDENDANYNKYKVTAKVVGKNLFDKSQAPNEISSGKINVKPNTTYYFYGKNTMFNGAYAWLSEYDSKGEKIANQTLWGFEGFTTKQNTTKINLSADIPIVDDIVISLTPITAYEPYKENNITFYIDEPLRGVGTAKDRVFIKDDKVVVQRNCGIRAYEDEDFGTYPTDKVNTVYPLGEPTYEEVEYNDSKLLIESFKNSLLSYNSNVPVTSKLYYSYSVPIVDTVAQTANVTDQQDSMIIDLATQAAVMEMMLM